MAATTTNRGDQDAAASGRQLHRPQFSLGGQVSSSHPRAASANSLQQIILEEEEEGDLRPRGQQYYHRSTASLLMREMAELEERDKTRSLNPAMLLKEFTTDEAGTTASPSSMFKSSFAREVVQNVRRGQGNKDERDESHSGVDVQESPVVARRDNFGNKQFAKNRHSLPNSAFLQPSTTTSIDPTGDAGNSELWMSPAQFVRLLERQERAEESSPERYSSSAVARARLVFEEGGDGGRKRGQEKQPSFLDQEARVPFDKLKQTCSELGLVYSEDDWRQLRSILGVHGQGSSEVRNRDFFAAVNALAKDKLNNGGNGRKDGRAREHLKDSLKSHHSHSSSQDSDHHANDLSPHHDLESCRSSDCDSGLERELAERDREICRRDRELAQCYRDLAERDTDLVRVRLECQRLIEDNRGLRSQLGKASSLKRTLELEKEVEHLKWQVTQVESSRKTYEMAANRLVTFLDEVTTALQATSPAHRRLAESTRAEVSRVARRAKAAANMGTAAAAATAGRNKARRNNSSASSIMSRAESLPGLNVDLNGSSSSSSSSSTLGRGSTMTSQPGSSVTLTSVTSSSETGSLSRRRNAAQRSQSIPRGRGSALPSLQEQDLDLPADHTGGDDDIPEYENGSVIDLAREALKEEDEEEVEDATKDEKKVVKKSKSVTKIMIGGGKEHDDGGGQQQQKVKRHTSFVAPRSSSATPAPALSDSGVGGDATDSVIVAKKSSWKHNSSSSNHGKDSGRASLASSSSSGRSTPNKDKKSKDSGSRLRPSDRERFKSLGSLQMEPELPSAPISSYDDDAISSLNANNPDCSMDSDANSSSGNSNNGSVLIRAQKMLRGMKGLLARERSMSLHSSSPSSSKFGRRSGSWRPSDGAASGVGVEISRDNKLMMSRQNNLQLLSHTSFPGLPAFPVLAASHSSPWNC